MLKWLFLILKKNNRWEISLSLGVMFMYGSSTKSY